MCDAHDPEAVVRNFDQRDRRFAVCRKVKPRHRGDPEKLLSMAEQLCLFGGDGEARDVVQTRLKRENRPRQSARLSGIFQKVQRNRLFQAERAGLCSPQHADVADGSQRERDVSSEASNVSALGDCGGQRQFFQFLRFSASPREIILFARRCGDAKRVYGDRSRPHFGRLACTGQGIGGLAANFDG